MIGAFTINRYYVLEEESKQLQAEVTRFVGLLTYQCGVEDPVTITARSIFEASEGKHDRHHR